MRINRMITRLVSLKTRYRKVILLFADVFLVSVCYLACWFLINGRVSLENYLPTLLASWGIFVGVFCTSFYFFGMYESLWRYAEAYEYSKCLLATITAAAVFAIITGVLLRPPRFELRVPLSIYFLSAMIAGMSSLMLRVLYRALRTSRYGVKTSSAMKKVLLVGAGETGNAVLQDIARETKRKYDVVCIVDDDPNKIGRTMQRIKIDGDTNDIPRLVEKYGIDVIILAMPRLSGDDRHRITTICAQTKCQLKKVPDLYSLVTNSSSILQQIRDVSVEDLLGREVIEVRGQRSAYLTGKRVLVTGAGGSIGSELCRQILSQRPAKLIMLDIFENGLYAIQQELQRRNGFDCPIACEIATVRDAEKMNVLFERYQPQVVYHAAAHKHVPLMESVPEEAVKNNVFGTHTLAQCADKHHVERFVLISTDKAVNPTNVMGATKRVCEMIIQSINDQSETDFVAVRFGNVLGSNGSVIPLFKEQIAAGGPVTVTDPEIIRYFMTISEAVSLVLTAGEMAKGGEIFVLDMGKPVKILELAENIIRMSGYEPYKEIEIRFTGLRPGEKLYEELLMAEEGLRRTKNEKIFIGGAVKIPAKALNASLDKLRAVSEQNDPALVLKQLHAMVPGFVQERVPLEIEV